jgi:hypothetical protein
MLSPFHGGVGMSFTAVDGDGTMQGMQVMTNRQQEAQMLELTIKLNEMLPLEMRREDFIAEQRTKLARLQHPLRLVREGTDE